MHLGLVEICELNNHLIFLKVDMVNQANAFVLCALGRKNVVGIVAVI